MSNYNILFLQYLAEGPKPLKGDLLVIVGSMLYACSNVTEVTSNPGTLNTSVYIVLLASKNYLITFPPDISGVSGQEEQQD
jgi:hypothetical protein